MTNRGRVTSKDRPEAGAAAPPVAKSAFHAHTADSPCLEAVDQVPQGLWYTPSDEKTGEARTVMTAVGPGWFRCTAQDHYWVHDHGQRFVSHFPNPRDSRLAGCA